MNVEIVGVSTRNKGAELMLIAINQHFEAYGNRIDLAVSPWFGSYKDRAKYGLLQKVEARRLGRSRLGFAIVPETFRKTYGMVTEAQIDAVIDASGFAFGDQHPLKRTLDFASDVERWKRQGKRIILLPQALGPFKNTRLREGFQRIVEHADIIYARDKASLDHAQTAAGKRSNLRLAPDITIGVKIPGGDVQASSGGAFACVVPNSRMLDKVAPNEASQYIPFLKRCFNEVARAGLAPKWLLHDSTEDHQLIGPVHQELGFELPIIEEHDPLMLKRIIDQADLLIGSRFHSLVGALSQATPAIAAGWSHKYDMLMSDFGCQDMVLSPGDSSERIQNVVQTCINGRDEIVLKLTSARNGMLGQLNDMWEHVDSIVLTADV